MINIYDTHHITPNVAINREIRRFIRGRTTWSRVAYMIETEVLAGLLHPDTNTDTIRQVALKTYAPYLQSVGSHHSS